jgi:hypothetical protein
MTDNLSTYSGKGAYSDAAKKLNASMQNMHAKNMMSPTSVITKTIQYR